MTDPDSPRPPPPEQPRNPLHGMTLEAIVTALVDAYGWQGLDERIPLRCFAFEPSIKSSLKLLRKTPWAREKVESLYLFMRREQARSKTQEKRDHVEPVAELGQLAHDARHHLAGGRQVGREVGTQHEHPHGAIRSKATS